MKRHTSRAKADVAADDPLAGFDAALNVLFLAAFPLILLLFQGSFLTICLVLFELGLFMLALRMISRGQRLHADFDAADVASRPRLPRKIFGSFLIGAVVFLLAGHQLATFAAPLGLGGLAMTLSLIAFGPDPMRDKKARDPETLRRQRSENLRDEVEGALARIVDDVARLEDDALRRQAEDIQDRIVALVRMLATDPDRLMRLRRPLAKAAELMVIERDRLLDAWPGDDRVFARRRFAAKMLVLAQSMEDRARRGRKGADDPDDAFEIEADLLIERMQRRLMA